MFAYCLALTGYDGSQFKWSPGDPVVAMTAAGMTTTSIRVFLLAANDECLPSHPQGHTLITNGLIES